MKLVCGNIVNEGQPLWGTYQLCNLCYTQFYPTVSEVYPTTSLSSLLQRVWLARLTKLHKSHHYWMLVLPTCTPSSTSKTGSADMHPSQYRLVALAPHQFSFPLPLLVFMAVSVGVVTLPSLASYCSYRATSTRSWEHGQMVWCSTVSSLQLVFDQRIVQYFFYCMKRLIRVNVGMCS